MPVRAPGRASIFLKKTLSTPQAIIINGKTPTLKKEMAKPDPLFVKTTLRVFLEQTVHQFLVPVPFSHYSVYIVICGQNSLTITT